MKIKTFVLSILTLILCAPCFLAADVFLVHGSKARLEPWYQPGGLFYEELSKQSKRMGLGKVIPYTWSGKSGFPESMHYGVKEHLKAAMGIATLLKTKFCVDPRPDNDTNVNHESDDFKIYGPVYLVGHSNGGVISELVSHLLYNPLSPEFKGKRTPPLFRSENGHHSFKDALSDSKRRCRRLLTRVIRSYQSKYTENDPQLKIEQIIMMATPMDRDLYSVNSRVANKVCSLFSMGDRIQWNFGRPPTRQRYPGNKNIVNFRVAIQTLNGGIFYPFHTQMRHPCVAKYLLNLFSDASKVVTVAPDGGQKVIVTNEVSSGAGASNVDSDTSVDMVDDASDIIKVAPSANLVPVDFSSVRGIDVLFDRDGDDSPVFEVIERFGDCAFKASGFY